MKYEHNCYKMNKKLKYKELFDLWTQRKGGAQQHNEWILSQLWHVDVQIFLFLIKNVDTTCTLILQKLNWY